MAEAKRILVLAQAARDAERLRAVAEKLALEFMLACSDDSAPVKLDFEMRDSALRVVELAHQQPLAAVIPVDDVAGPVAARACSMLGLPFHTPKAADACKDKALLRRKLVAHELASEPEAVWAEGSDTFRLACMMSESRLRVLAISCAGRSFSLPELQADLRERIVDTLRTMIGALGLKHGPVHIHLAAGSKVSVRDISLRVAEAGTFALQFRIPLVEQDMSFEEIVVRNALSLDVGRIYLDSTNAPAR